MSQWFHPVAKGYTGMDERPVRLAGKALVWQSIQMGGEKGIFMLRILVLTRLLTPDDFGLIAIATSALGMLLGLTNMGIVPALIQSQDTNDHHYDAVWTIGVIRAIFIAGIMVIAAPLIASIFAEPRAIPIIRIFAVIPIMEALASVKVAALNRNLLFRPLATMRLSNAFVHAAVSIALAEAYGVWDLVAGMISSAAMMLVISYFIAPYRPRFYLEWSVIRPIFNFGRWIFVNDLIALLAANVLKVVISRQIGASGLGLFYLASHLAFLPAEIASETFGNVAFPLFSRLKNDVSKATRVFGAMFTSMAALLFPVCAFLIFLAPSITREVFGSEWLGTEQVIQVLALVTMIGIFGEATAPVLKGFGQPRLIAFIELIQSALLIALVWIFTTRFGLVGAAIAWIPATGVSQFLSAYFLQKILDRPLSILKRPISAVLVITMISTLLAVVSTILVPGIIGLGLAGILLLGSSFSLLWYADRRYSLGFLSNLISAFPQVEVLLSLIYRKKWGEVNMDGESSVASDKREI
jgi:O-antigen/teichoic acid export membrane protein